LIPRRARSALTVAAIGTTQTLAWGSSYYLPAILADPISAALDVPKSLFFGFFSASLLLQAALGPAVGKAIDDRGGRGVLVLSNLVLGAGLIWLAFAQGPVGLAGAWAVLGVGMSLGLYDAAFATLTALYGREARGPITGITLIAGFASTVGWPLSALLNDSFGWRGACLGWAALNLLVCLPVNRFLVPRPAAAPRDTTPEHPAAAPPNGMLILAFVFGAVGFVTGAMAAHLPRLLEMSGASAAAAIAAASLMGPAQVAARLFEFGVLKRLHPLVSTRLALLMHPLAAAALGAVGAPAAAAFALLHGAGNGLLTISRGTLPLALFGPAGYGLRTGIIAAPARVTTAVAPLLFGLLLNSMGIAALVVSAGLSLAALASLALLRVQPAEAPT
jgi:MFS family permease